MIKPVLLLLLFLLCSSYGLLKNIAAKYRSVNMKKAAELIFRIENEIEFSGRDIYSVAKKIAGSDELGIMQYLSNRSFSPAENYEYAKNRIGRGLFLEKDDWKIIDDFFDGLGSSSRENQKLLCEKTVELLEKQSSAAEENYLKYSKLYTSSGILIGLFLVIILI